MAAQQVNGFGVKAVVDEEKNKVVFVESDNGFVDILFSFLTMPLGTIIKLARSDHSVPLAIGCMKNLYASVENIDLHYFHFHSEAGKLMLLNPRREAESLLANLKLKIDNSEPTKFFRCPQPQYCTYMLYSHYTDVLCKCGLPMNLEITLSKWNSTLSDKQGGVFVNGMTRFIVSDDLQVVPTSTLESLTLISKHGVKDGNSIHERTFNIGAEEVLNLLICSLQSRTPLTEVLLNNNCPPVVTPVSSCSIYQGVLKEPKKEAESEAKEPNDVKICLKLIVSKSKNMVCYAEAKKDFVNLLLSFLGIPLGSMASRLDDSDYSFSGCIDHLYSSVQDLDEQFFKSKYNKEMLVSPSLAFGFSDKNDLLGVKAASINPAYCYAYNPKSTSDTPIILRDSKSDCVRHYYSSSPATLFVIDPDIKNGGILTGLTTMFIVTDNLVISPISSIFGLSILKELTVPFNDIEEHVVHVGKEEALGLLLSSFLSESALTNAFLREPKRKATSTH